MANEVLKLPVVPEAEAASGTTPAPPDDVIPTPSGEDSDRPAVRYMTKEEADRASEKVFRVHDRLFAELAK